MKRPLLLAAFLASIITNAAAAQVVKGHILDSSTGSPVSGGFIRLQTPRGVIAAETMTDATGLYAVTARSTGWYVLRLERLGYETVVTDSFPVTTNMTRDFNLPATAVELPSITGARRLRCSKGGLSPEAAVLWEEVRKALNVTAWTEQNTTLEFDVTSKRLRKAGAFSDSTITLSTVLAQGTPFAALDTDSLMKFGFIRKAPTGYNFYAPDAELVMSAPFQETHCFRGTADANHPGMVGLGFQPDGTIKPFDVNGVLWLDRKSMQLMSLEFSYSGLPDGGSAKDAGGTIRFMRLSNGMYIIHQWRMWTPLRTVPGTPPTTDERSETVTAARLGGQSLYRRGN